MRFNGPTCRFCGDDIDPHPLLLGVVESPIIPYSIIIPQTEEAREEELHNMLCADTPEDAPRKFRNLDVILCDICRMNALSRQLKITVDPR
jgi:hypothetical protein